MLPVVTAVRFTSNRTVILIGIAPRLLLMPVSGVLGTTRLVSDLPMLIFTSRTLLTTWPACLPIVLSV